MKKPILLITCLTFVAVANAQFDFETGTASNNQFTNNFRLVRNPTYIGQTDPGDINEPNNDYLFGRKTPENTTSSSVTAIYDTTPTNAGDAMQTFSGAFTVSFDISTTAYNGGVGIYLINSSNPLVLDNNLFARFYFRDAAAPSGTNLTAENRLIISQNAGVASGSGGTRYTTTPNEQGTNYITGTGGYWHSSSGSYRADAGVIFSPELDPVWYNITLTYIPGDNNDTTLTIGYGTSYSATVILSNADRIIDPALGLFINHPDAAGTTKIDNFTVTMIPEPSSYALLLSTFAGGLFLCKRQRQN